MNFESDQHRAAVGAWSRLAIQLNGAADSGNYDHITTAVILPEARARNVFAFLSRELPLEVWTISKLTDVDRHVLSEQWQLMATAYEPAQFHVHRSGLALLVAYLLHLIGNTHASIPR